MVRFKKFYDLLILCKIWEYEKIKKCVTVDTYYFNFNVILFNILETFVSLMTMGLYYGENVKDYF